MKPLPGQMHLFYQAPATDADQAQRQAAAATQKDPAEYEPRCGWGDCDNVGIHMDEDGRPRCSLHMRWEILIR